MKLTSTSPLDVLEAVRAAAGAARATEKHFTDPEGKPAAFIEVPEPGVVHPSHLDWIAACLGQPVADVRATLEEESLEGGVSALAAALRKERAVEELRAHGVEPSELVLRRVPVAPGLERPNEQRVLSPVNAALQMFFRECRALHELQKARVPEVIIQSRALGLQSSFVSLLSVLRSGEPLFVETESSSEPLVIPPPKESASATPPHRPLALAVEARTAVILFPFAIACVDLNSGAFTTHALAEARLSSLVSGLACFTSRGHLVVFDTRAKKFVLDAAALPSRVVLDACCGISVLDTRSRKVATMPGLLASSGFDVAVSACGRYGWMCVHPRSDEVGVFSLEPLERVHQPWPHPTLGHPGAQRELGEGHDPTPRALARTEAGAFRLLYGDLVLHGLHAGRLQQQPELGAFDATSDHLVTISDGVLTVHRVDERAQPSAVKRWSLAPVLEQLAPEGLASASRLLEVMRATGTVHELAQLDEKSLGDRMYLGENGRGDLAAIISKARSLKLKDTLLAL